MEYILRGAREEFLFQLADRLQKGGSKIAGAVQENIVSDEITPSDIALHIQGMENSTTLRPNWDLRSSGCWQEPDTPEPTMRLAAAHLFASTDILIIDGSEIQQIGCGDFQRLIDGASIRNAPVFTQTGPSHFDTFANFLGDMTDEIKAVAPIIDAGLVAQQKVSF